MTTSTSADVTSRKQRVVVAMSGGVDSSVAAALLVEQGYDVVGIMLRLWSEQSDNTSAANRCCTPDQMADARRVAAQLDIPFYVLDVQDRFRHTIVQFFIDEHEAGRTPNPCIECNRQIRFTYLLERALALNADYLATGHYARVRHSAEGFQLLKAIDSGKDQSYVLHVLGQEQLAHVLFPIGEYTKDEVRDLARRFELPVSSKRDSQDLCFLADGDYRRFLREYGRDMERPGPIVDEFGRVLGRHGGLAFYTIGQRKGLGLSVAEPLYVTGKDVDENALIVGRRNALGRQELVARQVNWVSGTVPERAISAQVKIRYKSAAVDATIEPLGTNVVAVSFAEQVSGITAGQGAVFYDSDVCLGGGTIADSLTDVLSSAIPIPLEARVT